VTLARAGGGGLQILLADGLTEKQAERLQRRLSYEYDDAEGGVDSDAENWLCPLPAETQGAGAAGRRGRRRHRWRSVTARGAQGWKGRAAGEACARSRQGAR
jgi:hypothetical protein